MGQRQMQYTSSELDTAKVHSVLAQTTLTFINLLKLADDMPHLHHNMYM